MPTDSLPYGIAGRNPGIWNSPARRSISALEIWHKPEVLRFRSSSLRLPISFFIRGATPP
jgi:hypothetical protein